MSKLSIRTFREDGVIRAFFSSMDDTDRFEVSQLSISLADNIPGLFDNWVKILGEAHKYAIEHATGLKVVSQEIIRPHQKN